MSREVKNAVPKRAAGEGAVASTPTPQKDAAARGNAQGRAIRRARTATLLAVFAAVIVSLAFDSGLGTPSSFGIGEFFLLCPLGGLEALLASKALIPVTLVSLAAVIVFALLFGRAWCAWGCPVPPIRRFFKREPKFQGLGSGEGPNACAAGHPTDAVESPCASGAKGGCAAKAAVRGLWRERAAHIGRDPRTWTLAAVLIAALIAGFPFFCLVCPVGLTFGTVGSLWHLIVDKQVTMSVLVFPAALLVELVLYRKWCMNLCPIAGLMNIFGQFAHLFRPQLNEVTCLRADGTPCTVCTAVCTERIDMHDADGSVQLGDCTRCGECAKSCPTGSISFALKAQGEGRPMGAAAAAATEGQRAG